MFDLDDFLRRLDEYQKRIRSDIEDYDADFQQRLEEPIVVPAPVSIFQEPVEIPEEIKPEQKQEQKKRPRAYGRVSLINPYKHTEIKDDGGKMY